MPKKKKYKSVKKEIPPLLNEETLAGDAVQKEAIYHREGPLLVVAGAGTGKTRVITERIARLINDKTAEPSQILALTFSEKAAKEMKDRVDALVRYGMIDTHISTFHSFGHDVINDCFADLRIGPDWRLLRDSDAVIFIVENLEKMGLEIYKPLNNPAQYVKELIDFVSKLKDNLIRPEMYSEYAAGKAASAKDEVEKEIAEKHAELSRFYQRYENIKTEHNFMDYGDLIMVPYYLFREKKSVLDRYSEKYRYIMIDEFQDTNYAQFELIKLIADKYRNITVVGDDDQMIYRFRGAAISNIMGYRDYYNDAKVVVLKNNYRSSQPILDAAHTLIRNNADRLEEKLNIDKKLMSKYIPENKGSHLNIKLFENYSQEADFAAAEIKKLVAGGFYDYKDFAVLVRAKNDAKMFLKTFESKGIPFVFTGDEGLYNKKEVQFLLNFCRCLCNPYEFNPVFDVAVSEYYGLSPFTMSKTAGRAKEYSLAMYDILEEPEKYPEIELSPEEQKKAARLVKDIKHYSGLSSEGWKAGEILYDYVKSRGIFDRLLKDASVESERKISNISKFFEIIKQFSVSEEYDTMPNFVSYVDLKQKAGDNPSADIIAGIDEDAVQAATVHKAKGLEFKVVFVVGLIQGKFPVRARGSYAFPLPEEIMHDLVDENQYASEEERRLFYVAITRAQDRLYLTASKQYDGAGGKEISVYLMELGVKDPAEYLTKTQKEEKLKYFERTGSAAETIRMQRKKGPIVLSNYQLDDYLTCPFKYKLIHVIKMPIRENPNIIYGQAMHRVASEFYRAKQEGREPVLDELKGIFKALWKPLGFISREHEQKRFKAGLESIERFFNAESDKSVIPKFIEKSFEFKLDKGLSVIGRWDRIDEINGRVTILDYKTSDIKDEKKAKTKLSQGDIARQLTLYCMAYEKIYGKPVDNVGVYFFESAIVSTKKIRKETIDKYEKKILEVAEEIKKENFTANPNPHSCSQCAFSTICPHSKAGMLF